MIQINGNFENLQMKFLSRRSTDYRLAWSRKNPSTVEIQFELPRQCSIDAMEESIEKLKSIVISLGYTFIHKSTMNTSKSKSKNCYISFEHNENSIEFSNLLSLVRTIISET